MTVLTFIISLQLPLSGCESERTAPPADGAAAADSGHASLDVGVGAPDMAQPDMAALDMAPPDLADLGNDIHDLGVDQPLCPAGTSKPCSTTSPGICKSGTQACTSTGWGPCAPTVKPGSKAEVCGSGKDEDCDGKTDGADTDCQKCAPLATKACATGSPGVCAAGVQTCALAKGVWDWGACVATVKPGDKAEVCGSGKDEDCDGKTDGDDTDCQKCTPKATKACATGLPGICATGAQTCALAKGVWGWGACAATVKPGDKAEVCGNATDEDCDGKPDAQDPDCPSCTDKKHNGAETDVDCGGGACPACAAGKKCKVTTDCSAGLGCCGGVCTSLATNTNCGACAMACPGMTGCKSGKCACPSNLVKKGSTCVEDFDGASPTTGWIWDKPQKGCTFTGCTKTTTGESCKGCKKCSPGSVTACGNVGWSILASPRSGGGKAIQAFTYSTNGNCWQGDPVHKTYTLGRTISTKGRSIKLYLAAAGGGAVWNCGSLSIFLLKAGKTVASKLYKDPVHGSFPCGGTALQGNKKDFTFDLGALFGGVAFDAVKLQLYKYACSTGHWHTITVDDIVLM